MTSQYNEEEKEWRYAAPGTVADAILKTLCGASN